MTGISQITRIIPEITGILSEYSYYLLRLALQYVVRSASLIRYWGRFKSPKFFAFNLAASILLSTVFGHILSLTAASFTVSSTSATFAPFAASAAAFRWATTAAETAAAIASSNWGGKVRVICTCWGANRVSKAVCLFYTQRKADCYSLKQRKRMEGRNGGKTVTRFQQRQKKLRETKRFLGQKQGLHTYSILSQSIKTINPYKSRTCRG